MEDDGLFDNIIEHRTRIYENLANDSLTLLSIQLLIIPVSVSVTSLIFDITSGRSDTRQAVVNRLVSGMDYDMFTFGMILAISSIILTVLTYHTSRKRAAAQSQYLVMRYDAELYQSDTWVNNLRRTNSTFRKIFDEFGPQNVEEGIESPEAPGFAPYLAHSNPSFIRAMVTASIVSTLAGGAIIWISLFQSVYPSVTDLIKIFILASIIFLTYSMYAGAAVLFVEYLIGLLQVGTVAITSGISRSVQILSGRLKKYFYRYPVSAASAVTYISLMLIVAYRVFPNYNSLIAGISLHFGVFALIHPILSKYK